MSCGVSSVPKLKDNVILPTVIVDVLSANGEYIKSRALLDFGSQISIIRSDFVSLLGLKKHYCNTPLLGVGGMSAKNSSYIVTVYFRSERNTDILLSVNAVVLKTPTSYVVGRVPYSNLNFSDDNVNNLCRIDIIFGCDILGEILEGNKVTLRSGGPYALDTIFDYAVFGPLNDNYADKMSFRNTEPFSGVSLVEVVERFWKSEEPPMSIIKNPLDIECEQLFSDTVIRHEDGKYIARLPLIPTHEELGDSKQTALRRLLSLERRMKAQPEFKEKYVDFMEEYIRLGHMQLSDFNIDSNQEHYLLAHHGVFKSGDSKKIRVVFDGSVKTTSGVSLNDCLYSGEKLQNDITKIIINFRFPRVVFTTDIKMMFRMTWIHPDDRRYQLILWRGDPSEPVRVYELTTNTYGLKSSPFVAIRCLHKLANDESDKHPRAARLLLNNTYVDDINGGGDSIEEAREIRDELINILGTAGYELRKWSSNEPSLLADLPDEHCEVPRSFKCEEDTGFIKVLGVQWNPKTDSFTYHLNLPEKQSVITRRSILSSVAQLFDPLGWICPVVFSAKLLLQSLQGSGNVEWDTPAPDHLVKKWNDFISDLPNLRKLSIPRCLKSDGDINYSLHGFCDGSSSGFAAAVYLRSQRADGSASVKLIMAKSRVAPLKTKLTIPQLELNGALLLVNLLKHVSSTLKELTLNFTEMIGWCDSTIVLAWLATPPHKLAVFQGNRVSQINNSNLPVYWRHVPGEINCADVASRGTTAAQLLNHELWWEPRWLCQPRQFWPEQNSEIPLELPGLRSKITNVTVTEPSFNLIGRYSCFDKLINVTAYILRFHNNSKNPRSKLLEKNVSVKERRDALLCLIRLIQKKHFSEHILALKSKKEIRDSLRRLNLFFDKNDVLRIGGRICHSDLPYDARYPILLPYKEEFTRLLVEHYHKVYCHVGANTLAAILSRKYWIISVRRLTRSVSFKCIQCFRARPRQDQPFMADLPPDRVRSARPFQGVGTDFAGPFLMKSSSLRNSRILKCYLCIFVCLSTKAVHLEVVPDLSVEGFVAAFTRFVSRRGLPSLVRSDCGSNYVGTDKYLKELYVYLRDNRSDIERKLINSNITWLFNPPSSPNMGGLFEAAVKSAKTHMRRVIGDRKLTFEEMTTFFTKVEAVMNSRPLCPLSSDPKDLDVLTPGHFLICQPLVALPEYPFEDVNINRLSRFQQIQKLSQHFWSQWRNNYLHTLQQRYKWFSHSNPPKLDDLVLIKDDGCPSLQWKRGRIIRLLSGKDGVNRVAEVKTKNGVLIRPTSKLCRLPLVD